MSRATAAQVLDTVLISAGLGWTLGHVVHVFTGGLLATGLVLLPVALALVVMARSLVRIADRLTVVPVVVVTAPPDSAETPSS